MISDPWINVRKSYEMCVEHGSIDNLYRYNSL